MKEIQLNRGFVAFVSDEDFGRVNAFKWTVIERKQKGEMKGVYVQRSVKKSLAPNDRAIILLHRFILDVTDPKIGVDHWDGNGLNNTRENLRLANGHRNQGNSRKHKKKTSHFKGVYLRKDTGRWTASISPQGKFISLGCFDTEEEAAKAYDKAARETFKEFACVNYPENGEQSALV